MNYLLLFLGLFIRWGKDNKDLLTESDWYFDRKKNE